MNGPSTSGLFRTLNCQSLEEAGARLVEARAELELLRKLAPVNREWSRYARELRSSFVARARKSLDSLLVKSKCDAVEQFCADVARDDDGMLEALESYQASEVRLEPRVQVNAQTVVDHVCHLMSDRTHSVRLVFRTLTGKSIACLAEMTDLAATH